MKLIFALIATAAAAPVPNPQLDGLLSSLGGLFGGGAPAAPGAANPLAGLTSLIPPGLDLGALASSFLGGGAPAAGGNATGGAAAANPLAGLLPPGLDFGALASSFLGGGAAPAGGAAAANPLAGLTSLLPPGLDLGSITSLLGSGGLDIGALLGGFLTPSGPTGDVAVIVTSYGSVKDKVTALDSIVGKLQKKDDWSKITPQLDSLTKDIGAALQASVTNINGMAGAVDVMSALNLAQPGGDVTEATKTSIQGLIAKKDEFPPEARKVELENLKTLLSLTQKFNEAVNAKLPIFIQPIAASQGQQSVDVLQQAVTAFSS